jgi:hypothetical protein
VWDAGRRATRGSDEKDGRRRPFDENSPAWHSSAPEVYDLPPMSDVVGVALVTAGSSLAAAALGAYTTSKVSRRNAETTVSTAKDQAKVELATIAAENERLRMQQSEDERRNRRDTYLRLIAASQQTYHWAWGPDEDHPEVWSEWRLALAGVQLFGAPRVIDATGPFVVHVRSGESAEGDREEWNARYSLLADSMIDAMRVDVGGDPAFQDVDVDLGPTSTADA